MKKALISGITGQDGSYLADFLIEKGYEVHGMVRRTSTIERSRLSHLYKNNAIYNKTLFLHYADMDDIAAIRRIIRLIRPDEFYHLAGQSHVGLSYDIPETTCTQIGMSTLRILEILRDSDYSIRFYHPSSSEVFGIPEQSPQNEQTPFRPVTPYGCAKAFSTNITRVYRESYKMHTVNGISYNHESPRRGEAFVSQKICKSVVAIKLGKQDKIHLGNIDSFRDWGHAKDYVLGMWLSLQRDIPDDYVFSTGILHSVKNILEQAFSVVGLSWQNYVNFDEKYVRIADPHSLVGDSSKAKKILKWQPEITFSQMIEDMVIYEYKKMTRQ